MKQISLLVYFSIFFQILLQSQTLDATLLELEFSNDGYPEVLTGAENGFYFSSQDDQLWFSDGSVEGTYMVKDFDSGTYDEILQLTPVGDKVYFTAHNRFDNREVWVSDGTEEGTIQLTDRNVSFGNENVNEIISFNSKIYFNAYDDVLGYELWVSDGTKEGTFVFKDIAANELNSNPRNLFIYNDKLIFRASQESNTSSLWISDGTANGTYVLKDFTIAAGGQLIDLNGHIQYNGLFYFFLNTGNLGLHLWKSDGTTEGTVEVKTISDSYQTSNGLTSFILNNKIVFAADDGIHGIELWQSDGTNIGTNILKDINPGQNRGFTYNGAMVQAGNKLFFPGSNGSNEIGLWVTNGTSEGTQFVKEISSRVMVADPFNSIVYFYGDLSDSGQFLWKSDGSPNGTIEISNIAKATNSSVMDDSILTYGGKVFFSGNTEANGTELWETDGTLEGTKLFYDIDSSYGVRPSSLTTVDDILFFNGNGRLCTSDGTIQNTIFLEINSDGRSVDDESEFIDFNGNLIVSANDGIHGYELWISDGSQEGTKMIKDINTGSGSSMLNSRYQKTFTIINGKLYFMADDGVHGFELWASDGTEAGTYRITDIAQGTGNWFSSNPGNLVFLNGYIYFSAHDGNGTALYKTDGTPSGTSRVTYLNDIRVIKVVNNRILLVAETSGTTYGPHDLWVSDGTASGTNHLMSFGDGIDSDIQFTTILDDQLYFVAGYPYNPNGPNPKYGKSIFKTDGTEEGTVALFVGSEHPFNNPDIDTILACGNFVYFGVQPSLSSDKEIWRTDGTVEGTILLAQPEGTYDSFLGIDCIDENVFFKDSSNYHKLKFTNGDPNQVHEIGFSVNNGPPLENGAYLGYLKSVGNRLFFSARTEESGDELYVTIPSSLSPSGQLVDNDGDGVIDLFDKCPSTPNGEEVNDEGCADSQLDDDEDGITNDIDQCPETPSGEVVNAVGCSENDLVDDDIDGVNNNLDLCPNTPLGESVNINGCAVSQIDEDEDGVMDNVDICPETLPIYEVDIYGCPVLFELPSNNFTIKVTGVTCVDKNNGQISIRASETYNYTAKINGDDYTFSTNLLIQNLYSGSYNLCITVQGEPDFERCFILDLEGASEISGKSTTSMFNSKITETIEISSGTGPYTISINGEEKLTTMSSLFSVNVENGDFISVSSKFPCEGQFNKQINSENPYVLYPNPTKDWVNIFVATENGKEVPVKVYNGYNQLLKAELFSVRNNSIHVSLLDKPSGIYFLKIETENPILLKVIRQ